VRDTENGEGLKELQVWIKPETLERLDKIKRTQGLDSRGEAVDWVVSALNKMSAQIKELIKGITNN
jgi:hypothetical protein